MNLFLAFNSIDSNVRAHLFGGRNSEAKLISYSEFIEKDAVVFSSSNDILLGNKYLTYSYESLYQETDVKNVQNVINRLIEDGETVYIIDDPKKDKELVNKIIKEFETEQKRSDIYKIIK